jgi:hypothetical protein
MSGFGNPKLGRVWTRNHVLEMTKSYLFYARLVMQVLSVLDFGLGTWDFEMWLAVGGWRLSDLKRKRQGLWVRFGYTCLASRPSNIEQKTKLSNLFPFYLI